LPFLFAQLQHLGETPDQYVIHQYFPEGVQPDYLLQIAQEMLFGTATGGLPFPIQLLLLLAFPAAGLFLAVHAFRRERRRQRLRFIVVFCGGFLPLLLLLLISLFKPILLARYLITALPMIALFYGMAFRYARPRVQVIIMLFLILCGVASHAHYIGEMPRENWAGVADALQELMGPEDVVVCDSGTARSCLIQYLAWNDREDLADNVFPFDQFLGLTGGGFPFRDKRLFALGRRNPSSESMMEVLRSQNQFLSSVSVGETFRLYLFTADRSRGGSSQ
jgi:hypothetical protein